LMSGRKSDRQKVLSQRFPGNPDRLNMGNMFIGGEVDCQRLYGVQPLPEAAEGVKPVPDRLPGAVGDEVGEGEADIAQMLPEVLNNLTGEDHRGRQEQHRLAVHATEDMIDKRL